MTALTMLLIVLVIASLIVFVLTRRHYKNRYNKRSQLLYTSLNELRDCQDRIFKMKALLKGMQ
jgi:membrane-associated HD superfamily phosphohydrolase